LLKYSTFDWSEIMNTSFYKSITLFEFYWIRMWYFWRFMNCFNDHLIMNMIEYINICILVWSYFCWIVNFKYQLYLLYTTDIIFSCPFSFKSYLNVFISFIPFLIIFSFIHFYFIQLIFTKNIFSYTFDFK